MKPGPRGPALPESGSADSASAAIRAEAVTSRDAKAASRALATHLGRTALVVLSIASPMYKPVRIRRALATACGE
ncbi:hypothetical protein ACFQ9U_02165 [Streptomyces sp. NPDC056568]|uniref:hypothetical protein n=1 Tax=Streptomyces sp. NPDC056568 TaxID=3345866 RepID=UPI0036C44BD5